jgi:hypothetical protein
VLIPIVFLRHGAVEGLLANILPRMHGTTAVVAAHDHGGEYPDSATQAVTIGASKPTLSIERNEDNGFGGSTSVGIDRSG